MVQDVLFIRENGEVICGTMDQRGQKGLLFSRSTLQLGAQVYAKKVDTVYLTMDKPVRYVPADQLRGKAIPPRVQAEAVFVHIPDAMLVKLRVDAGLDPDLNGPLVNWEAQAKREQAEREAKQKAAEEEREAKQKRTVEELAAKQAKVDADNAEVILKRDEIKQLLAADMERAKQKKVDDEIAAREDVIKDVCAHLPERAGDLEKALLRENGNPYDRYSVPKEFAGANDGFVDDIELIERLMLNTEAQQRIAASPGWERYTTAVKSFKEVYSESRKKLDKWNNGGAQALANMSAEKRQQEAEQSARISRNLALINQQAAQRRANERADQQELDKKRKSRPDTNAVQLGVPKAPGMPTGTPPGMTPGMPPTR
jgi:hypothetical protein